MNDDYLWDGTGKPDPEIQKLESLLAPMRYAQPAPEFEWQPQPALKIRQRGWTRWRTAFALACALAMIAGSWWFLHPGPSYEVVSLAGSPQIESARGGGRLGIGQWLQTDANSRARIRVGDIGEVEIEPKTRIRLMAARPTEHRLILQRGTMHATIWAPPRLFFVETPFAEAVDLGCAYTLEVDEEGAGLLQVTSGWVAFQHQGRESFVPAGALCRTNPGSGPGIPYLVHSPARLQAALQRIESGPDADGASLAVVMAEARKEDAFTLWHLLVRAGGGDRSLLCDRLAQLVPMPAGVTRAGVLAGDLRMLDSWWDALGLGNTGWWRLWERPWREPGDPPSAERAR